MQKTSSLFPVPEESIASQIYVIRNQKVMLDRDLAKLYGVETKVLKQSVRRNISRFPEDFMFEMDQEEMQNWRSQIVTSRSDKIGMRHPPFCFTEQGVAMLSSVLKSERAIAVNIQIIRIFAKMREMNLTHKDSLIKLEQIEKKILKQNDINTTFQSDIELIFQALKHLLNPQPIKRKKIGYRNE